MMPWSGKTGMPSRNGHHTIRWRQLIAVARPEPVPIRTTDLSTMTGDRRLAAHRPGGAVPWLSNTQRREHQPPPHTRHAGATIGRSSSVNGAAHGAEDRTADAFHLAGHLTNQTVINNSTHTRSVSQRTGLTSQCRYALHHVVQHHST